MPRWMEVWYGVLMDAGSHPKRLFKGTRWEVTKLQSGRVKLWKLKLCCVLVRRGLALYLPGWNAVVQ